MDEGRTSTEGAWALLPLDLLLQIFRRLESTSVIRCSCTCKPWRRAIIGNASFLHPRPDRFVPNLLLGVFHGYGDYNHQCVYLRRTPGPFQSALPSTGGAGSESRIQSLVPANGGFDREMYTDLLSSRDGFILLKGRQWWSGVCLLCNPMTGDCKILPDATIRRCTYVLLTGYDGVSVSDTEIADQDLQAVRVLAVAGTDTMCTEENRITYQVFSFASGGAGAWGPVKRSVEIKTGFWVPVYDPCTVVSGDAVYWLGGTNGRGSSITCAVALDVRTGRTWTTELPEGTQIGGATIFTPTLLATSDNGRLSLIRSPYLPVGSISTAQLIQVWVLMDDDQWSLQKTIDLPQVQKLLPNCPHDYLKHKPVLLNAFCPRSGCVIGTFVDQEIHIDLEGSSHTCVELISRSEGFYCNTYNTWIHTSEFFCCNNTYEMDWSTYISKMKQF